MTDVIFVHGAWVGPRCWDRMRSQVEKEGLVCEAPAWPHDDRPYAELRASPDPALAGVGVEEIVDHYAAIVARCARPPLLIGHSFGGLIVQKLLSRGLGSAGVAIDSAPPRGIFPVPNAVRASLPVLLSWGGWKRVLRISYEAFAWGFVHGLPENERRAAYEEHQLPTPGRPFFQVGLAPFVRATAVDFAKHDRAPLLLIGGAADRTVPCAMNRANHRAYRRSSAITEYRELPHRTHWIIAEPGWEEVASIALEFARKHGAIVTSAAPPRGAAARSA